MPLPKDKTMLRVDSVKFNIALANAELEPKGCYIKPIYLGKISKALGVKVADLIG